jgi:UDP-N-acetyl-D-glucosamine/UDP-N-acetyl-D-galactosamine dehydrogenase
MKKKKLCIVGLGYVGLPLAIEFSKHYEVVGFDISKERIRELRKYIDRNNQFAKKDLKKNKNLKLSFNAKDIKDSNIYIITVPTPINKKLKPDLKLLISATKIVSNNLNKKDYIIFESTVYPGCVDNICIPIIEKLNQFKLNKDFYCGYSPERINPGDKKNTLPKIKKVVAGSNNIALNFVYKLYKKIIHAGVHKVSNLRTAEAAKIIENVQRDLNIALVNELSLIFNKMNIDTEEVLEAASTKWNFHRYKPGLVGGHCIGVDPYYLTEAAKKINYNPKLILAGRQLNNSMPLRATELLINFLKKKYMLNEIKKLKVLMFGFAFKENCPDIRNTKVYDLYLNLKKNFKNVKIYDPEVSFKEVYQHYNLKLEKKLHQNCDILILAVPHNSLRKLSKKILLTNKKVIFYDLKSIFPKNFSQIRL